MREIDLTISYLSLNKKPKLNDDAEVTGTLLVTIPIKTILGIVKHVATSVVGYFDSHS